jgi:4,5:9,10-diseco-3-hydroxy-5,9,17-trioxoandrosta-1(10),2-diene-4-oate hydrolase
MTVSTVTRAIINNMIDTPLQRLSVSENHFAYRVCGSGPDVLLIHGWISSGRMWECVMEHLAPEFRVWAIDLIGFGDSRTDDETRILAVDDQTRLTVAFCQAVGIQPHAIVGHSMGGAIALKMGLDFPDLVNKLVLVCSVVTGRIGWNLDGLLATSVAKSMLGFGQYVWPTMRQATQMSFLVAPGYLTRAAAQRTVEDFQKATWSATYGGLLSLINIRLDKRLHELNKPTLIITGSCDLTVPPSESQLAAKLISGSELLELSTCHHQVPDEDPLTFNRAVGEFLRHNVSHPAYA